MMHTTSKTCIFITCVSVLVYGGANVPQWVDEVEKENFPKHSTSENINKVSRDNIADATPVHHHRITNEQSESAFDLFSLHRENGGEDLRKDGADTEEEADGEEMMMEKGGEDMEKTSMEDLRELKSLIMEERPRGKERADVRIKKIKRIVHKILKDMTSRGVSKS